MSKLFAVVGNPVLHSKSPLLFNKVFKSENYDNIYTRLSADSAAEAFELFESLHLDGMNVTSPFKEDIIDFLDEISDEAKKIGSVNTVIRKGLIVGENTDHIGVVKSFKGQKIRKCLVLGAGGAARAAVFGLVNNSVNVTVINRTYEKAKKIAEIFGCLYDKFENLEEQIKKNDAIISTIPSMKSVINKNWIRDNHIIFDAVYKNSDIEYLSAGKDCKIITGEDWLYNQAIPAYVMFNGRMPNQYIMKEASEETNDIYKKKSTIALIGFMGSGKSSVGKNLAEKLGYKFVETDAVIETKTGLTIPEIFKKSGENYFRKIEKEVLTELAYRRNIVISCGGGIIEELDNRKLIKDNMISVWLHAPVKICLSRIKKGSRPLLDCDNPLKIAIELFNNRKSLYAESSELVVNGKRKIHQVVQRIYEEINKTFQY